MGELGRVSTRFDQGLGRSRRVFWLTRRLPGRRILLALRPDRKPIAIRVSDLARRMFRCAVSAPLSNPESETDRVPSRTG